MVKELTVQKNDIEMYINIKNYLATLSLSQTPPETNSKTNIPKIQPYIHKNPKILGKHQQEIPKKILKLKKIYQMLSPSKVRKKKQPKFTKKN